MLHLSKINKVANITNKTYHFVMSQLQTGNFYPRFLYQVMNQINAARVQQPPMIYESV